MLLEAAKRRLPDLTFDPESRLSDQIAYRGCHDKHGTGSLRQT